MSHVLEEIQTLLTVRIHSLYSVYVQTKPGKDAKILLKTGMRSQHEEVPCPQVVLGET